MQNSEGTARRPWRPTRRQAQVAALVAEHAPWLTQLSSNQANIKESTAGQSDNLAEPEPEPEAEARAERRRLRSRANQMQRAEAAVHLSLDALSKTDRLVVLNACLTDALQEARDG